MKNTSRGRHARFTPAWRACFAAAAALAIAATPARAEEIGAVDTVWKLIGANHKVVVEAYDDPGVLGVTCYVSRAKTGGISGSFGLAEDKSEASIACRQVGPLSFPKPLPQQEEVFSERLSILFKRLRVVRMHLHNRFTFHVTQAFNIDKG